MKAIVYERYGPPDVLQVRDVPKPTPEDDEILVRIRATTVRTGDWRMRKPDPPLARLFNGLLRPRKIKILGMELAGVVESVGSSVTRFAPGDEVFASTELRFGAHAQYTCLPEDGVVAVKPSNMDFAHAAAMPSGALAALSLLQDRGHVEHGQKVLVYGASGSVGSYAVQVARALGAEVTAVCSTRNVEWVGDLGAREVIDYTRADVLTGDARYDLVFDAVGKMVTGIPRSRFSSILAPGGRTLSIEIDYEESAENLETIRALVEAGEIVAVIDRTYPLEEIIEAHRYVEQGHKKGNVVILVD